jgi:hypothetical protein
MRAFRWPFALLGIIFAVGVLAAVAWDFRRSGVAAYLCGPPVAGALVALAIVNRPRLSVGSLGGCGTGACQWFVNYYFRDYTGVTVGPVLPLPLTEALAGAIFGAVVGAMVVGAARLVVIIPRMTTRDWMLTIVLLAVLLTGLVTFIRSSFPERLVIAGVVAFVALPCLLAMGFRRHRNASPDDEQGFPASASGEP